MAELVLPDRRLQQPGLYYPKRRPIGPVRDTLGFELFVLPDISNIGNCDIVGKYKETMNANHADSFPHHWHDHPEGIYSEYDGVDESVGERLNYEGFSHGESAQSDGFSMMFGSSFTITGNQGYSFEEFVIISDCSNVAIDGHILFDNGISVKDQNELRYRYGGSITDLYFTGNLIDYGKITTSCCVKRIGSNRTIKIWVNGEEKLDLSSAFATFTTHQDIAMLAPYSSRHNRSLKGIVHCAWMKYGDDEGLCKELSVNPYAYIVPA